MCIVALPADIHHIVQARHIVADFGTDKVVPVPVSGLDSLDSLHLTLQLDSWEQMNHIARTGCNSVLVQAVYKTRDSQVFGLLVALRMPG